MCDCNLLTYCVLVGYLLCSINFATIISRLFGISDPTKTGSGNAGATNVFRSNKIAGTLTAILDFAKGFLFLLLVQKYTPEAIEIEYFIDTTFHISGHEIIGLACILGHIYPFQRVFLGKSISGKGVATGFGVGLFISPILALIALGLWIITIVLTKTSSIGGMIAVVVWNIVSIYQDKTGILFSTAFILIILWSHRSNIKKLLSKKN
jgi:acyl phosphate:glycerol-3-phosphate acyltransferase